MSISVSFSVLFHYFDDGVAESFIYTIPLLWCEPFVCCLIGELFVDFHLDIFILIHDGQF